jgi:hypothetical protein
MPNPRSPWRIIAASIIPLGLLAVACGVSGTPAVTPALLFPGGATATVAPAPAASTSVVASAPEAATATSALSLPALDKMSLWTGGTHLRGANLYQRHVYPEIDGTEFLGPGPVGPPVTLADLQALAAQGANYVNISGPGIYTERPPYQPDPAMVSYWDGIIGMAEQADLFVVITFREGPGRNDFAIIGVEGWGDDSMILNTVWSDPAAQDAWVQMWRYTADRYKDRKVVVGYDLMCEPNSNEIFDMWDAPTFYAAHAGSSYDWNQLFPRILAAIREVDASTPVLVGGNSYSDPMWLPYTPVQPDPRVVYTFHQYTPHEYTHQEPPATRAYPGQFDANYDGAPDQVDRAWLERMLMDSKRFADVSKVSLAVNEYGAVRWVPGAETFLRDEMDIFEQSGWNYAIWAWEPAWPFWVEQVTDFNLRFGPDPQSTAEVSPNPLMDVLRSFWARNIVRPSNFSAGNP